MNWIDIKKDKPKEANEFIITYLDCKREKQVGSAWWNEEAFEDWGEEPHVIEDVIGWMMLPSAMQHYIQRMRAEIAAINGSSKGLLDN